MALTPVKPLASDREKLSETVSHFGPGGAFALFRRQALVWLWRLDIGVHTAATAR